MTPWLAIAALGVAGVLARVAVQVLWTRPDFPYATLSINALGCFLIGVLHSLSTSRGWPPEPWRMALMAGFLGGLTTFSSYSLDCLRLWQDGRLLAAGAYAIASPVMGLALVALGAQLSR